MMLQQQTYPNNHIQQPQQQHGTIWPPIHSLSPSRTVVTSFTPRKYSSIQKQVQQQGSMFSDGNKNYYEEGDWIVDVDASKNGQYVSCAISNGEIQVYDPRRLHCLHTLRGNGDGYGMITDLKHYDDENHNLLMISGLSSPVSLVDLRCHQQQTTMMNDSRSQQYYVLPNSEQATSLGVGYDGTLIAVGSNQGKIHFFDVRQQTLLGTYQDCHTDAVTEVQFLSNSSSLMLSGSEDGLAYIYDTSKPNEESAIKSVFNVQSPIRNIGFMGPNFEGVYCLTGSETLSIWHAESAQCLINFDSIRYDLSRLVCGNENNFDTMQQQQGRFECPSQIEYLVDAHWDATHKELLLMSGNSDGDACLTTIAYDNPNPNNQCLSKFSSGHILRGGHRGVIRGWCPLSSSVFVTVGEDARLCEWNKSLAGAQTKPTTPDVSASTTNYSHLFNQKKEDKSSNLLWNTNITSNGDNNNSHHAGRCGGGPLRRLRNKRSSNPY